MKKILILFLILSLPVVYSQPIDNFNDYNYLDISFSIYGKLKLIQDGSNPVIKELTANLTFFPKKETNQDVLFINERSNPNSEININKDNIGYYWEKPSLGDYNFGFDSTTKIKNTIIIINKKIKFPVSDIEINYIKPTEFIDINEDIKNKALELAQGKDDLYQVSFDIASWVEDNIKYNLSTLTANIVQKSSWVLKNKQGVCDELTNLFISMMRSLGIPARFVSGMAYTNLNNDFGPHAWAEVYFPEKGWIPFDITYGQFGWVDPTHIKLKTNIDSGDSSVIYSWKSSNVKFESDKIDLKADIIKKYDKISSPISLKIKTLIDNVGPGSYVPVEIEIINNNNFYVPETVFVTKSFNLTEKNIKSKLLKPLETKKIFWIMHISEDIESGYSYSGIIEIKDIFNTITNTKISYSSNLKIISLKDAQDLISSKEETEENKVYSPELKLKCSSKENFLNYENVNIECDIKNGGNTLLKNINTCIINNCQNIPVLSISESKKLSFDFDNLSKGLNNIIIKSNSNNIETTDIIQLNILDSPELKIYDINYKNIINYNDNFEIKLDLTSKVPVKNVVLYMNDNPINLGDIENSKKLNIETNGKNLKNILKIKINYKDDNDKDYIFEEDYPIEIINIPWYIKLFRTIGIL